MSKTVSEIRTRLNDPENFVKQSQTEFKLNFDDGKCYSITKTENDEITVERDYDSTSCCDCVRTAFACFFHRSNRQRIQKELEENLNLFDNAGGAEHFDQHGLERQHLLISTVSINDSDTAPLIANAEVDSRNYGSVHSKGEFTRSRESELGQVGSLALRDGFSQWKVPASEKPVSDKPNSYSQSENDPKPTLMSKSTPINQHSSVEVKTPTIQRVVQLQANSSSSEAKRCVNDAAKAVSSGFKPHRSCTTEDHHAAAKIQALARGFLVRKNNADRKVNSASKYGRFCMTHPRLLDYKGEPLKYYFDRDGIAKAVHRPTKEVECLFVEGSGSFKDLKAKGERVVELGSNSTSRFDDKSDNFIAVAQHLAPYPSCCPSVQIDSKTLLARSGGTELKALMRVDQSRVFDINCFHQSCIDLAKMHKRKIFLRDIKAENMAIMTINGREQAMFIDTDDAAVPTLGNYSGTHGTYEMTTQALFQGKQSGDHKLLEADDNYAKLLLMTEATFEVLRSQPEVLQETKMIELSNGNTVTYISKSAFKVSRVNGQNRILYQGWVDKHVKLKYRANVMDFLSNPAKNILNAELVDVIAWPD